MSTTAEARAQDHAKAAPSGEASPEQALAQGVLVVRHGPGANCSSIGSAVEMLFLSATVGAAVLGALVAALQPRLAEPVDAHAGEPPPDDGAARPPAGGAPADPTEAG